MIHGELATQSPVNSDDARVQSQNTWKVEPTVFAME